MSEYYNMNRGLNYIKKHYNNSDQNELGEYVTELIDMIEVKDDIRRSKNEKNTGYGTVPLQTAAQVARGGPETGFVEVPGISSRAYPHNRPEGP